MFGSRIRITAERIFNEQDLSHLRMVMATSTGVHGRGRGEEHGIVHRNVFIRIQLATSPSNESFDWANVIDRLEDVCCLMIRASGGGEGSLGQAR